MINWKSLISKYGKQEAAHKFEEIALAYVKDVYPQYSWYPTKRTRDGNKDAQRKEVYFGIDDSYDVWEEAKFKSEKPLRRQDIDPTVLSGLLQGNVRLIIFVTNASLPDNLLDRAVLGARIRGIKVSCVLADQLESWLTLHPDVYEKYWGRRRKQVGAQEKIIWIHKASFSDIVSTDFRAFDVRTVMCVENIYLLTVSISSNIRATGKLQFTVDFPFIPVLHPNYDDPEHLNIENGLSTFALLLKAVSPFSGGVNLQFEIAGALYSRVTAEVEIVTGQPERITYSQQLQITSKIAGCIRAISTESTGNLISLFASSGMGKSFILKSLHQEFGLRRDMTIVSFESNPDSLTNYLLLCQIVLFLYYGNIFWLWREWTPAEREQKKTIAIQNNTRELFDDATLSQLFDGCFDAGVAKITIENLAKKKGKGNAPTQAKEALAGKLLLIDDFQYLNQLQADFLYTILAFLSGAHNNCVIVVAATKHRFSDEDAEKRFLSLTPNSFELNGLTPSDMAETLGAYFSLSPKSLIGIAPHILAPSPLLTCELLRALIAELGKAPNDTFQMVKAYSASKNQALILKNRFAGLNKQYYLLDIIYRFKKGIPSALLKNCGVFDERPVAADLALLSAHGLVCDRGQMIAPYHDYYVLSYLQLRQDEFYNDLTGRFLHYLLEHPNEAKMLDTDQILSMLISCGKQYQVFYEAKVKAKIRYYMGATQFGAALHYCAYYYKLVKEKEAKSLEREDFKYIFHYAYCLVHCGDRDLANELLTMIYKTADSTIPEKYSAGAELLSQRFWEANLDGTIEDSRYIQSGAAAMLKLPSLCKEDRAKLEHAYSTCFNRRMVILLLQDRYDDAQAVYAERLNLLSDEYGGDEFCSRSATLIMDYARGLSFLKPKTAEHLLSIALKFFQRQPRYHYRRILLCQVDLLVLRCVNEDASAFWSMDALVSDLRQGGFYSEYFKALLKRCACCLVYLSQQSKGLPVHKAEDPPGGAAYAKRAQEVIASAMLDCDLQPAERDAFLFNNLKAYFSICEGEKERAVSFLRQAEEYIQNGGESYRQIILHNIKNVATISRIAWGTSTTTFDPNTFFLDCRFW